MIRLQKVGLPLSLLFILLWMSESNIAKQWAMALALMLPFFCSAEEIPVGQRSLEDLEERLQEVDAQLQGLAHFNLNTSVGAIGYRSIAYETKPEEELHLEVNLLEPAIIDQIVLAPTVWRDQDQGYVADAFPLAFRIVAGTGEDRVGREIARLDYGETPLKSIAPVILPIEPAEISWLRLEATRLSKRARDGKYVLQLAEIMAFSGRYNQALRRSVKAPRTVFPTDAWQPEWLVDGVLPYVMNAATGYKSLPMISIVGLGDSAEITIDLGHVHEISRLRLHAVDQGDTIPQAFQGDFGIPKEFMLEGSTQADFSDAIRIMHVEIGSIFHSGSIMEWAFVPTRCRYVRLTAAQPYVFISNSVSGTRIGFAELELLGEEGNVALGAKVSTDFELSSTQDFRASLTDGQNLYGEILPIRKWLEQLAMRRDLEAERPELLAQINRHYLRQKKNFRLLVVITIVLVAIIACSVLYYRSARQRQEAAVRERIAANLHDELGANLHAIGLLGDLAKDAVDSREDLIETVTRIRSLTERTGRAAINCTNLLQADGFCEDLISEMRQDASHLLGDLEFSFEIEGEAALEGLRRRTRLDMYLFYKEALTNIIRHSGATKVVARLHASPQRVELTISDNGVGLKELQPKALMRRARLLRAELTFSEQDSGKGTRIHLVIKPRRFGLL